MSDTERANGWFESGLLVHPCSGEPGFADLVRAFQLAGGAPEREGLDGNARSLAALVGEARHHVLVLVDGLGAELVERLPPGSFLRNNLARTLRAVFPATTASALTTLATGLWPCDHCIPGWWTRLTRQELSAVSLLFTERASGRPLSELGIAPSTLYPVPSAWPGLDLDFHSVLPGEIAGSVFAGYLAGGTPRVPYTTLERAMLVAENLVAGADRPAFVYVYLPQLDTLLHGAGSSDPRIDALVLDLDARLGGLAKALGSRARLVVTSDHGLVDVRQNRVVTLGPDDPLVRFMACPPTGEPSVPVFHLRPGEDEAFAREFSARFGELFALLTVEEAESMKLYGPGKLVPLMKERLGSFIGIAPRPAKLYLAPTGSSARHRAIHGGLRPGEMLTPLVVV